MTEELTHRSNPLLFKMKQNTFDLINNIVSKIPPGKVATYGQVARLAGIGNDARMVTFALHNIPSGSTIPWHRVVNRFGKISYAPTRQGHDNLQFRLLKAEGVLFDENECIDLKTFQWTPGKSE